MRVYYVKLSWRQSRRKEDALSETAVKENSASFDKLPSERHKEFLTFSQIQSHVYTARLLREMSAETFNIYCDLFSQVSDQPWSDLKKGYVIYQLSLRFWISWSNEDRLGRGNNEQKQLKVTFK